MNLFWTKLLLTLGTVGATYLTVKATSKEAENIKQDNNFINKDIKNKSNISNFSNIPPKDSNILVEISKYLSMYVTSVKYKDYNLLCQSSCSELLPKIDGIENSPQVAEYFFYQHLKNIICKHMDFDKDKKLEFDKLKNPKVVRAFIFSDWVKNNVYEFEDIPIQALNLPSNWNSLAVAECVFSYDDVQHIELAFFKYNNKSKVWQLYCVDNKTLFRLSKLLKDITLNFYNSNCKIMLDKRVLSKIDDNRVFENHIVTGVVTSNKFKGSISGVDISLEKLYVVYDKVWYETKLLMEALQKKKCAWFVRYEEGIPVALYMSHDESSELVGGFDINTQTLTNEITIGGIWKLLDD